MATAKTYNLLGQRFAEKSNLESANLNAALLTKPVLLRFYNSTSVNGDSHTFTVPWKCRIVDAWTQTVGAAATTASTVTIANAAGTAATVTLTTANGGIIRASIVVPAYADVAAGSTIACTMNLNGSETLTCWINVLLQVLP